MVLYYLIVYIIKVQSDVLNIDTVLTHRGTVVVVVERQDNNESN